MARLINGNGNRAIYAAQDADLIASLAGNVTCIANVGNKYAATIEDANTIGLSDGVIITKEGRRIQLDAGDVDLFVIPTGSSGVTNYYIIGYKLVQQADSSQVAETFVQKMSSSSETIPEDTFRSGATDVYVSLYRVQQNGVNLGTITGLLPELKTLQDGGEASDISFDNSGTSISSSNVQGAIEELDDDKANLNGGNSINGIQILRDSRAWANIPNGSSGETVIEFKDKNNLNMGYIRPWKKSDGTPILDIFPPDNGGEIHLDGKIPVTQDQIIDNLSSTATDKPLSAKQGKVLHDYIAKLSTVTPSSSGKSTLVAYIKDVIYPMGLNVYSFTAVNFPDLPISSWYFEVTVYAGNGFANVTAFKANDKGYYYVRGLDGNLAWDGDWARLSAYELKTWSGAIGSNGLINTGISTTDYMIVGVTNDRAAICIPLSNGANWYVQCFDLGGATPSGGNINLTLMCVRI